MPASPRPADVLCRLLAVWPDDPAGFAVACSSIKDWPAVLHEASRHGVLGVLERPLLEKAPSGEIRAAIESRRLAERLWSDKLGPALDEALTVLEAAGTQTAVLKGPILSERLYDEPTVRISTDLDILISPTDLDRAVTALETLGYKAQTGPAGRYYRRHHHHLSLERPSGPQVELHFRGFTGLGTEIPAEKLLVHCVRNQSPRGPNYLVLSPEDEFLFLAVHAAGHGFARLIWLYDLKIWLRKFPSVRWPVVFSRARRWQVETALGFALKYLQRRFGTPVPEVGNRRPHPMADRLLSWSGQVPEESRRGKLLAFLLQASLCDRPGLAISYLGHHFGRILRRRLQRWLPRLTPEEWSG